MTITTVTPKQAQTLSGCRPGSCSGEEMEQCRAEIRDMVIEADNILTYGTLALAGTFVAPTIGFFLAGTLQASSPSLAMASAAIGGVAGLGSFLYSRHLDGVATEAMEAAYQRADDTGCYTREELYRWYRDHVVG